MSCRVDGRTVARGLANILLSVETSLWTAARPLRRGEELGPDDLIEARIMLDREAGRLFRPDEGRKWRLARDIKAGTRLRASDVRPVPDVEAGTEITLVARTGQASVTVVGRVRRSGNVGDTILVHNPVTGALVQARLVDGNTAVLVTPGRAAGNEEGRSS